MKLAVSHKAPSFWNAKIPGKHLAAPVYFRCFVVRPSKNRLHNRLRSLKVTHIVNSENYRCSDEHSESLTIALRPSRKPGLAYKTFYASFALIAGLMLFCALNGYSRTNTSSIFSDINQTGKEQSPNQHKNLSNYYAPILTFQGNPFIYFSNEIVSSSLVLLEQINNVQTGDDSIRESYTSSIHIDGQVTEQGTNTPINAAKVVAIKELNNSRVDSTYTNSSGIYNMNFIWTNASNNDKLEDRLYPNPYNDKTNIELYASTSENYTLRIFDITGKLLLNKNLELNQGKNLITINGGNIGVHIIDITNGKDKYSYKAIQNQSTDNQFSAQVESAVNANNLFFSNDAYSSSASTSKGSFKSETSITDNILRTGDLVRFLYTKAGYYDTDTVFIINVNQTVNKQMEKILLTYVHNITGTALSSNPSKQIIDGTQIYIVKSEADTAWVNTTSGNFNYSFTDATPVTSVHVGAKAVAGHNPNDIVVNVSENTPVGIMFNALNYSLSQPVIVKNQYAEGVSGAQVAGGDVPVFTDATGKATYTRSNLETNTNNLPFSNYATDITVTKDNIQTLNQIINSITGTNAEQLLNTIQEYLHYLWGNSTSPAGTQVVAWKDAIAIHNGIVNGTNYQTNQIKRTTKTFTADSITFSKPGYVTFKENNVVLVDGGNKKEATLPLAQQYATLNFTLKLFTQDGHPITETKPNASNTIQWADNTTNTYPVNANGEITVSKLLPINNGSFGNATFSIDTTNYNGNGVLPWMIFRRVNQSSTVANIAQNQNVDLVPEYTVVVPLDSLANKTIHEYTLEKELEGQPGVFYRMDKQPATGFIGSSGVTKTSKFIKIPSTVAPYLDFVQKGWNETTNQPVPQADLNRSDAITQQIINMNYLPNGDTLLPPHRMYTVASTADPRWQALVARGFDNSVRSAYYNSTPQNGREWIGTYTYNGEPRIWRTSARYNTSNSNGTLFSEKYSATFGIEEGSGGSLVNYVYNYTTNQATEFAVGAATMTLLLDLGTH